MAYKAMAGLLLAGTAYTLYNRNGSKAPSVAGAPDPGDMPPPTGKPPIPASTVTEKPGSVAHKEVSPGNGKEIAPDKAIGEAPKSGRIMTAIKNNPKTTKFGLIALGLTAATAAVAGIATAVGKSSKKSEAPPTAEASQGPFGYPGMAGNYMGY